MRLDHDKSNQSRMVIKGGAKVTITCTPVYIGGPAEIVVRWRILQHAHGNQVVEGRRLFSHGELAAAFDLSDECGEFGEWLIMEYGGTTAEQALFIRYRNYLNIPCPGTGHDGDPNVSILLDEEIKAAAHRLLAHHHLLRPTVRIIV